MSGWNYRILRHRDPLPKSFLLKKNEIFRKNNYPHGYVEWFALHEVYYNNRGNPNGVTTEPCKLTMDEFVKKEFNWIVKKIKQAGTRPILDYKTLKEIDAPVKSSNRLDNKRSKTKRVPK